MLYVITTLMLGYLGRIVGDMREFEKIHLRRGCIYLCWCEHSVVSPLMYMRIHGFKDKGLR